MQNHQIEGKDGKMYWVHRAIAISAFVFKHDIDNNWFVLANKRGKGTPDFQGMWNCPCDYLDWDETLKQACSREVKEECGISISSDRFTQFKIHDTPDANLQNVTVRHYVVLSYRESTEISIGTEGEANEVEEVMWMPVTNIGFYQWAFNHDKVIKQLMQ
jgi:ADP-ribose pyrophosphatase YjhB (NUDIX family)